MVEVRRLGLLAPLLASCVPNLEGTWDIVAVEVSVDGGEPLVRGDVGTLEFSVQPDEMHGFVRYLFDGERFVPQQRPGRIEGGYDRLERDLPCFLPSFSCDVMVLSERTGLRLRYENEAAFGAVDGLLIGPFALAVEIERL